MFEINNCWLPKIFQIKGSSILLAFDLISPIFIKSKYNKWYKTFSYLCSCTIMWRRYLLISITHFWLIQVISLTNSKDSSKFNQGIMLAKLSLITLFGPVKI